MDIVLTKRRECNSIKLDVHFQHTLSAEQLAELCKTLSAKCRDFGDLRFIEFSGGRITASTNAKHLTLRCDDEFIKDTVIAYIEDL